MKEEIALIRDTGYPVLAETSRAPPVTNFIKTQKQYSLKKYGRTVRSHRASVWDNQVEKN